MSFTVKVYLEEGDRVKEIRRFALDQGASANYEYVVQKIGAIFPGLRGKKIHTFWRDGEGDKVTFSSDDELMEALSYKDDIFKVYLAADAKETQDASQQSVYATSALPTGPLHPHVCCDVCDGPVRGMRYKCTVCPDYDLCSTCERRGEHSEHDMLRIAKPRCARRFAPSPRPPPPMPCHPWPCYSPDAPPPPQYCAGSLPKEWAGCSVPSGRAGGGDAGCRAAATLSGQAPAAEPTATAAAAAAVAKVAEQARSLLEPLGIDIWLETRNAPQPAQQQQQSAQQQQPPQQQPPQQQQGQQTQSDSSRCTYAAQGAAPVTTTYPYWPTEVPAMGPWQQKQQAPAPMDAETPASEQDSLHQQQQQQQVAEADFDSKVAAAVESMRTMGFHDDQGWLTAVLRTNGCDVARAIEEALRKAR